MCRRDFDPGSVGSQTYVLCISTRRDYVRNRPHLWLCEFVATYLLDSAPVAGKVVLVLAGLW